jgi:hypothetical protein
MSEVRVVLVLRLQGTTSLEVLRAVSSLAECYFYIAALTSNKLAEMYGLALRLWVPDFSLHFIVIEFMIKQELRECAIYGILIAAVAIQCKVS